VTEIYFYY